MAIPTSKPLNLSTVQTEYGGSNPISMSEYRGKGNAPASGAIDLWADFNGTANSTVVTVSGSSIVATFTVGVGLAGCRNGQYNTSVASPSSDVGSFTNDVGFFPTGPVSGVTNWRINALTQENGTVNLRFKNANDTTAPTNSTHWVNVTRDLSQSWPIGDVVFSQNADGTGNPITVAPSDWTTVTGGLTTSSYTTQWAFQLAAGTTLATSINTNYVTNGGPTFYMTFYP